MHVGPSESQGRISRGFRLLGQSWRHLREEPRLLVLPAISAVALTIAIVSIFVPVLWLTEDWSMGWTMFVGGLAIAMPWIFISTFLNVAFLAMVQARLRGETPEVRAGLRFARSRWRAIAGWTAMATLVGAFLAALQQLPVLGEWVGRLLSFVGGVAWAVATFFVVPVLAVEGVGARESVRRSAHTMKSRWGEAVTGQVATGTAGAILAFPGLILMATGVGVYEAHVQVGSALLAVGLVLVMAVSAVTGAINVMFQFLLYRLSVDGEVAGPFSEQDLASAIKPKGERWWKRG